MTVSNISSSGLSSYTTPAVQSATSTAQTSATASQHATSDAQGATQNFWPEFRQLGQDLNSGNLSAAQSDSTTLTQDSQPSSSSSQPSNPSSLRSKSPIEEAFSQLAQDLQSGNLAAAQQDYLTIQHNFQDRSSEPLSSVQDSYNTLEQSFQEFAQSAQTTQSDSTNVSIAA